MKKLCFAAMISTLLFFTFGGCTSNQSKELTQQKKEQIKNEVKPALDSIIARWAKMDVEGCLQYYSPDLEVVDGTLRHGFEEYKKLWIEFNKSLASLKVTTIREDYIVCTTDIVISTWVGKDDNYMKSGEKMTIDPHAYTLVFKKVSGQWKVIFSHASGTPVIQAAEKK